MPVALFFFYLWSDWTWWSKFLNHCAVALTTTSQPAYTLWFNSSSTQHNHIMNTVMPHKYCSYIWITGGLLNSNYALSYLQTVPRCYAMSLVNPALSVYVIFQDLPCMPLSWLAKNNTLLRVDGCPETLIGTRAGGDKDGIRVSGGSHHCMS